MIIQGPMGIVADRASGTKEGIWIAVELGQSAAIAKGFVCSWDLTTDNTGVAGILQDTRGLRVVVCPASTTLNVVAGVANKDIAANAAFASSRSPISLLQTYGFRTDIPVTTAAGDFDTVIGGVLTPSSVTAGRAMGCTTAGVPTAGELNTKIGTAAKVVAVNTVDVIAGIINVY